MRNASLCNRLLLAALLLCGCTQEEGKADGSTDAQDGTGSDESEQDSGDQAEDQAADMAADDEDGADAPADQQDAGDAPEPEPDAGDAEADGAEDGDPPADESDGGLDDGDGGSDDGDGGSDDGDGDDGDGGSDDSDDDDGDPPSTALDAPATSAELLPFLKAGAYDVWASEPEFHTSSGPHGGGVRVVYGPKAEAALRAAQPTFPAGAATVKELSSGGDVYGWAVWVKVQQDSANGDGFYWYEIIQGEDGDEVYGDGLGHEDCVDCHRAGRRDYLLSANLFE